MCVGLSGGYTIFQPKLELFSFVVAVYIARLFNPVLHSKVITSTSMPKYVNSLSDHTNFSRAEVGGGSGRGEGQREKYVW